MSVVWCYDAGVDTAFFVIQYQAYLSQALSTEVVAKGNYFKAAAGLSRATGTLLDENNVTFDDPFKGPVRQPWTLHHLPNLILQNSERDLSAVWLAFGKGFGKVAGLLHRDAGRHRRFVGINDGFNQHRASDG